MFIFIKSKQGEKRHAKLKSSYKSSYMGGKKKGKLMMLVSGELFLPGLKSNPAH